MITLVTIVGGVVVWLFIVLFAVALCSMNSRLPELTDLLLGGLEEEE